MGEFAGESGCSAFSLWPPGPCSKVVFGPSRDNRRNLLSCGAGADFSAGRREATDFPLLPCSFLYNRDQSKLFTNSCKKGGVETRVLLDVGPVECTR